MIDCAKNLPLTYVAAGPNPSKMQIANQVHSRSDNNKYTRVLLVLIKQSFYQLRAAWSDNGSRPFHIIFFLGTFYSHFSSLTFQPPKPPKPPYQFQNQFQNHCQNWFQNQFQNQFQNLFQNQFQNLFTF